MNADPKQARYLASPKGKAKMQRAYETRRALLSSNPRALEEKRATDRAWAAANPGYLFAKRLRQKYGVTVVRYLSMIELQGSRCALCRGDSPGKRAWCVDHDHDTLEVRGVLCHGCNMLVGLMGDCAALIKVNTSKMLTYLHRE